MSSTPATDMATAATLRGSALSPSHATDSRNTQMLTHW